MTLTELRDRARGCILAGAVGDAMGGPFEGQVGPLDYVDHAPWSISDDTQLTLATCESIIETGGVSPEHIASRFLVWFRERRITGIGASTLKALRDLDAGAHWALSGARGEMAAGNGAAMRVAPLAFSLDPSNDRDRQKLRDVCRITHHNDEAYVGGLAVMLAIRAVAFDEPCHPGRLLEAVVANLPDSRVRDRLIKIVDLPDDTSIAEVGQRFGCSGYVVESVPLALFAASQIDRLPLHGVLRSAIECGGDTDTIAAIVGQVAGACIGASEIPPDRIELLSSMPVVCQLADAFADTVLDIGVAPSNTP